MATVYLSPTGSDSNTYAQAQSSATPWATIAKVEASATTGDSVILAAGTYTWASVGFTKSFNFSGATSDPNLYIIDAATNSRYYQAAAGGFLNFTNILFKRNYLTSGSTNTGWFITQTGSTMIFTGCIFSDLKITGFAGAAQGGGFALVGNGTTITLYKCRFSTIKRGSYTYWVIFRTEGTSICTLNVTNCTWKNDETTDVITGLIDVKPATTTANFKNNIWMNTGSSLVATASTYSDFNGTWSGTTSGTGNITSDPLFVDAANNNFNLRPSSPCIDAGTNL
jgi:hypothetical protein